MNKLTGFVTIVRTLSDGKRGKAVAYTKDGSWFDYAVVLETPIFDSNMYVGGVWFADEILPDDEVCEASGKEVSFYNLKVSETSGYREEDHYESYKDFIDRRQVGIGFESDKGEEMGFFSVVPKSIADKACKLALKELARTLLEMKDMNLAADMLGRIRDEEI